MSTTTTATVYAEFVYEVQLLHVLNAKKRAQYGVKVQKNGVVYNSGVGRMLKYEVLPELPKGSTIEIFSSDEDIWRNQWVRISCPIVAPKVEQLLTLIALKRQQQQQKVETATE